jgi:cell division protein FtsI (penicillin-binding protein 3)
VRSFEPRALRQVISSETARTLTEIMTTVVRDGTGHAAAIPGYDVAGKTGTAQKMDPATRRYSHAPGVLSFVGFVPADDPRLVILVLLDEPKNERWGSEAAAPIFAAIGREALRYLNVPPRDTAPVHLVRGKMAGPPSPAPATAAPAAAEVQPASLGETEAGGPLMPRLQGLSLRQALAALSALDVRLEITGRGSVVAQSPAAGTPLVAGAICRLILASSAAKTVASP